MAFAWNDWQITIPYALSSHFHPTPLALILTASLLGPNQRK